MCLEADGTEGEDSLALEGEGTRVESSPTLSHAAQGFRQIERATRQAVEGRRSRSFGVDRRVCISVFQCAGLQ